MPGNSTLKSADEAYLIQLATNFQSCAAEIAQVKNWATKNNLSRNWIKSEEIFGCVTVEQKSSKQPAANSP